MRWVVIAVLGAAFVAGAVMFREDIQELFDGGDSADTLVYGFDGPVTPAVVERARTLVGERVVDLPVTVHARGDRIEIEVPDASTLMEVWRRMAEAERFVPRIELRILDYDPAYFRELRAPLRKSKRAKELGVTLELDRLGYHLQAPTAGMYVNTAWAEAHGCPTTHRIEGTGVYCTVTGEDRIAAVLHGDALLFADAVAPALPADRELVIGTDGVRARAYLYERTPMLLEASVIAAADTRSGALFLSLSPSAAAQLQSRVTDPATQLVRLVRGVPSAARLHEGGSLELAIDAADARRFVSALSYAHLPHRLREAPTP